MKASLLLKEKYTDGDGDLLDWVVWEVAPGPLYREGIRYRLAFIPQDFKMPAVLYDNHHPKGHHKHLEELEQPYLFVGVHQLLTDFEHDVNIWKKIRSHTR